MEPGIRDNVIRLFKFSASLLLSRNCFFFAHLIPISLDVRVLQRWNYRPERRYRHPHFNLEIEALTLDSVG